MCGIVGVARRDRPVEPQVVQTMCDAIRHRGPDDDGFFISTEAGLGMRRLSIIDLVGGRQPIFNEDGSKVIVFNGEIYNYRALRGELLSRGHRFRSHGDTETILHLYEDLGPRCVERLRGMFTFAIWDRTERSLFLARDRFGIKPLFYGLHDGGIVFASELKALLAAGLSRRVLDWDALDAYLQLGYIPAPGTPFTDVRKLPAAHWLQWRASTGAVTVSEYWDLPRRESEPTKADRDVLEWLDESVAAHLVSDVPVAAFLSGGLDSSAVVASWALATPGDAPHAFTARYTGSGAHRADETPLAQALADRYQARLSIVDIHPDLPAIFEPIVEALDEPHADDSAIPTWLLSQAVGRSYKVVLTGIGGDELFAGYRRHLGLLAVDAYARLPRPLRRLAAAAGDLLPDSRNNGLGRDRLKRFLRAGDGGTADRYLAMVSRLSDPDRSRLYRGDLRAALAGDAARRLYHQLHRLAGEPGGLNAALYLDYKTYLADDLLALSDRLSMAHSLEVRVPLVDHELVERVFTLPARTKIGRTGLRGSKRLLKRALSSRLPASHLHAPKRGFVGPTAAWLRDELRPMLEDELSAERMRRLGYFDPAAVTRLLDEHLTRRHNRATILWALLCFSAWHRRYLEQPVRTPLGKQTAVPRAP